MDGSPNATNRDYNPALDPRFQAIGKKLFLEEGGYVCNPADPGGATKLGISLRYLVALGRIDPKWVTEFDADRDGRLSPTDIQAIAPAEALDVYGSEFWVKTGFYQLPQPFDAALFDEGVNAGPTTAVKLLQRALNDLNLRPIDVDGVLGNDTRSGLSNAFATHCDTALLRFYRQETINRDQELVRENPTLSTFLKGWIARAGALGNV